MEDGAVLGTSTVATGVAAVTVLPNTGLMHTAVIAGLALVAFGASLLVTQAFKHFSKKK